MNNLHDSAVLGVLKMLERFSYFAYILARENDKALNLFLKYAPAHALQKLYEQISIAK